MLLAIDTSTKYVGLALYDGDKILAESVWESQDYHTVELAPALKNMLDKAGKTIEDLKVIAVALGPGSFTGLRVGIGLAKGLSVSRHIPLVGVSSFEISSSAQPLKGKRMVVALRAGRERFACGWFKPRTASWKFTEKMEILTPAELAEKVDEDVMVCGELSNEDKKILRRAHKQIILPQPAHSLRRPGYLAQIGWNRWEKGLIDDPVSLSPIYLQRAN